MKALLSLTAVVWNLRVFVFWLNYPDVISSQIEPNNLWDDVPFAPIVVLVLEAFEFCAVADGFSNKSNFLQKIVLVDKYQIPTVLIYGVHASSGLTLFGWFTARVWGRWIIHFESTWSFQPQHCITPGKGFIGSKSTFSENSFYFFKLVSVMLTSGWECGLGCHCLWSTAWFGGKFPLILAPEVLPHLHCPSFCWWKVCKLFVLLLHELYLLICSLHVYSEKACLYGKFSMTLLLPAKRCCLIPLTARVLLSGHLECQVYGYEKGPFWMMNMCYYMCVDF